MKRHKIRVASGLTAIVAAFASSTLTAYASPAQQDNLAKGCAFYNAGQYDKALAYLQDTVSKKPRLWEGHYYLANTYLSLGQRPEAYQQYQVARACKPPANIMAACDKIIGQLYSSSNAAVARTVVGHSTANVDRTHEKFLMEERQKVFDRAGEHSQKLSEDTYDRNNGGITRVFNTPYGQQADPVIVEQARKMQNEIDGKTRLMMDDARKRAANIK